MFGLPREITNLIFREVQKIRFKERIKNFEKVWTPTKPTLVMRSLDGYYIYRHYVHEYEFCWHICLDWDLGAGSSYMLQVINTINLRNENNFSFGFIDTYREEFTGIKGNGFRDHTFSVVTTESSMRLLPIAEWSDSTTIDSTDTDEV